MRSGTSLPTIQLQRNFWTSWSSFFLLTWKRVHLLLSFWDAKSGFLLQFFSRQGLEFHHQLHLKSFEFKNDENGKYVTLSHETQQKTFSWWNQMCRSAIRQKDVCWWYRMTSSKKVLLLKKTPLWCHITLQPIR